jgi:hypothetical protein
MQTPSVAELIPILQTAIGPVILISGVGLLLLSMTNRLSRVIDTTRLLGDNIPPVGDPARSPIEAQLQILWSRARLIRTAIFLASSSALTASLLIIVIFLTALFRSDAAIIIITLFAITMALLVTSLIVFIRDVNKSLTALRLELRTHRIGDI